MKLSFTVQRGRVHCGAVGPEAQPCQVTAGILVETMGYSRQWPEGTGQDVKDVQGGDSTELPQLGVSLWENQGKSQTSSSDFPFSGPPLPPLASTTLSWPTDNKNPGSGLVLQEDTFSYYRCPNLIPVFQMYPPFQHLFVSAHRTTPN